MKQGFRGNCGFKGKLGMCPSLAEPDSGGFPRRKLPFIGRQRSDSAEPYAINFPKSSHENHFPWILQRKPIKGVYYDHL